MLPLQLGAKRVDQPGRSNPPWSQPSATRAWMNTLARLSGKRDRTLKTFSDITSSSVPFLKKLLEEIFHQNEKLYNKKESPYWQCPDLSLASFLKVATLPPSLFHKQCQGWAGGHRGEAGLVNTTQTQTAWLAWSTERRRA